MKLKRTTQAFALGLALASQAQAGITSPLPRAVFWQDSTDQAAQPRSKRYVSEEPVPDVIAVGIRMQDASLQIKLGTNLDKVERDLVEIWAELATRESYMQQISTLGALAVIRSSLYIKMGDYEAAKAAAETLFLSPTNSVIQENLPRLKEASPDQLKAAAEYLAASKPLKAIQSKLASPQNRDDFRLQKIVKEAFESGDYARLTQVGPAGFDALANLVLEDKDIVLRPGYDPLTILASMSPSRCGELVLAHFDDGGRLWKRRILLLLQVNQSDQIYYVSVNGPGHIGLKYPVWGKVIARLLSEPELSSEALELGKELLGDYGSGGILFPQVMAMVKVHGEAFLGQALESYAGHNVEMPLLVLGAKAKAPRIRSLVARKLARMRSQAPLELVTQLVGDDDRIVRLSILPAFDDIEMLDAAREKLLMRIVQDPDSELRLLALRNFKDFDHGLSPEVLKSLANDPEASVRAAFAKVFRYQIRFADQGLVEQVALGLVNDPSSEVRAAVEEWFAGNTLVKTSIGILPAFKRVLQGQSRFVLRSRVRLALITGEDSGPRLAKWILESKEPELTRLISRTLPFDSDGGIFNSEYLSPNVLVKLIRLGESLGMNVLSGPGGRSPKAHHNYLLALQNLVVDPSVPVQIRANALAQFVRSKGKAKTFDQDAQFLCVGAILQFPWGTEAQDRRVLQTLLASLKDLDDSSANAILLHVIESQELPEWVALGLMQGAKTREPSYDPLIWPIIKRWFDLSVTHRVVQDALLRCHRSAVRIPSSLLENALKNQAYEGPTLNAMCALRRPEFASHLGVALLDRKPSLHSLPTSIALIEALRQIGTDEAVGYLVSGLDSNSQDIQQWCSEALDAVEAMRARRARWKDGIADRPSRASALGELLTLLKDENPTARALAVRGVGAFGAVEYIPTLIGMLKDPSTEVREAVVDAVKRLSALPLEVEVGEEPAGVK